MYLKEKNLYASNGDFLKKIQCPKYASIDNLQPRNNNSLNCNLCEREVLDTDQFSENELETILRKNPETCLKINLLNPMFSQYEDNKN